MSSTASRSAQPTAPVAGADSSRARANSAATSSSRIGVLLVEDHAVVRTALRLVIERQYDMHVVGEASSGEEAITQARTLKPDVVVMDVLLPGMDGAEATEQICRALPETRVVALTMCEEESWLRHVLLSGASGYVLKRSSATELCQAIRTAAGGGVYIDPQLAPHLVDSFLGVSRQQAAPAEELSDREKAVLQLIALGYTHREIAHLLCVSRKTVDTYRARISEKLGLSRRVELVRYCLSKGLLSDQALRALPVAERHRRGSCRCKKCRR